jgi:hypothetical protein
MKKRTAYIKTIGALVLGIMILFTACKEDLSGPETVPIRAEIKQVIVNNSIYVSDIKDDDRTDELDSVVLTIPQGTDVSQLDLDIIYSYFGEIDPQPGITDLTNPVHYTITSNIESRVYAVMTEVVPPSLTSFLITSPREVVGKIEGDRIILKLLEGLDYSSVSFSADFFGESISPSQDQTLDLSVDTTIKVINKEFESVYTIQIDWYKDINFTGVIYDCTIHPNEFLPGAIESEDSTMYTIVEDEGSVLGGKVARFTSLLYSGNDRGDAEFDYGDLGLDDQPEEVTVIIRGKGYPTHEEDHRYVEIAVFMDIWRYQFWVEWNGLDGNGYGQLAYEDIPGGLDPLEWNIYRLTANRITGEVKIYLNESPEPLAEMSPLTMEIRDSENWKASFGDASGGNSYDGAYDYIIIETGGAYSPVDLPLSKILGE